MVTMLQGVVGPTSNIACCKIQVHPVALAYGGVLRSSNIPRQYTSNNMFVIQCLHTQQNIFGKIENILRG